MKVIAAFFPAVILLSLTLTANLQSTTSPQRSVPVAVGDIAPDFALQDQNGNKVALSAAREKSPVVLVFYRGYW